MAPLLWLLVFLLLLGWLGGVVVAHAGGLIHVLLALALLVLLYHGIAGQRRIP